MKDNHHYNKQLKVLARQNRSNMTKAEKRIWHDLLKGKALEGYQFLRQRPIDKYIADFMCKELMLIIEIDGESHTGQSDPDYERQLKLESLGFNIIRFSNEEVMDNLPAVHHTLLSYISQYQSSL